MSQERTWGKVIQGRSSHLTGGEWPWGREECGEVRMKAAPDHVSGVTSQLCNRDTLPGLYSVSSFEKHR